MMRIENVYLTDDGRKIVSNMPLHVALERLATLRADEATRLLNMADGTSRPFNQIAEQDGLTRTFRAALKELLSEINAYRMGWVSYDEAHVAELQDARQAIEQILKPARPQIITSVVVDTEIIGALRHAGTCYNLHAEWRIERVDEVIDKLLANLENGAYIIPYSDHPPLLSYVVVIPDGQRGERAEGQLYVIRISQEGLARNLPARNELERESGRRAGE